MSASVIVLPVVRIERVDRDNDVRMHVVRAPITGLALTRLRARAKEWNVTLEEAASGLLDRALAPPVRRRKP